MRYIFLNILLVIGFLTAYADNSRNKHNEIRLIKKSSQTRPQAPSSFYMVCSYDGSTLDFEMPDYFDVIQVSISDSEGNIIATDFIDAENYTMEIELSRGVYTICCTSQIYGVFSGQIEIL